MLSKYNAVRENIDKLENEVSELGNMMTTEFERAKKDFSNPEGWDDWSSYDAPITTRPELTTKFSDLKIPF